MSNARSYKSWMVVLAAAAFGAARFAGYLANHALRAKESLGSPSLVLALLLGFTAVAFAAGMPWWRKLDDLQKSGQLNAWYFGGQVGGLVVLLALVAFTGKSDYSRGALALLVGELAGFVIFWLVWRWHSRGPAE